MVNVQSYEHPLMNTTADNKTISVKVMAENLCRLCCIRPKDEIYVFLACGDGDSCSNRRTECV